MLSAQERAYFETTRRLLAEIINEGLVSSTVTVCQSTGQQALILADNFESQANLESWLRVGLLPNTYLGLKDGKVISLVRPANLQPPVTIGSNSTERESLDPEEIFDHICPWLSRDADASLLKEIRRELKNSRDNQEKWLEISERKSLPGFNSPSVDWERTLIFGHPSHPYHRLCFAQAPLKPYSPEDLPGMLSPSLAFVSVPRTDMRVSGSFEETLGSLLTKLEVPSTSPDRLIVPCLVQQLPAVKQYFPSSVVVKTVQQCADAQASLRTLTLRPELNFPYHIKLSLACNITSALRTITPWTTIGGPVYTELLERFLPPDLWVFREVASITGGQTDFNQAKHLSCILRSDLEVRARTNNEKLILAAALAHHPADADQPYAQILYNLDSQKARQQWFRSYIACLFKLVLPPLLEYGIGLEAHGQNMVARICLQTGEIKGFAVRDFGGIRLHVPTLQQHGVMLDSVPSGSATLTHNLHDVWSKVHHSMLQNHVGFLLSSLGLENDGGWSIVREELSAVLRPGQSSLGQRLYDSFLADTMPFKCFLRMRMEGKYRDYVERELPNVLLTDSPRWEDVLATYKPSLHRS